jgi:hypothetical protein
MKEIPSRRGWIEQPEDEFMERSEKLVFEIMGS